jgi:hypothetical protein
VALIYCPFRSLLLLPTWVDRRRTFERVAASLCLGGRFAWNAFAFDHQIAARLDGQHQEEPVPHTIRYAVGDNRIDIRFDDGSVTSAWWATKNEWLGLLDVAGLSSRLSSVASTDNSSTTKAANTSSSPAAEQGQPHVAPRPLAKPGRYDLEERLDSTPCSCRRQIGQPKNRRESSFRLWSRFNPTAFAQPPSVW